MFQQNRISIHIDIAVKNWFAANNVQVLLQTAKGPDLNTVENIWTLLVVMHAGSKQCESHTELLEALNNS